LGGQDYRGNRDRGGADADAPRRRFVTTVPKMTVEDLCDLYGHLQGQIAATTNVAAALAALHPDKQTIERVIQFTATGNGYQQAGGSSAAEKAYVAGMQHAMAVFRAALAGLAVRR
jgi:hypothetical protein